MPKLANRMLVLLLIVGISIPNTLGIGLSLTSGMSPTRKEPIDNLIPHQESQGFPSGGVAPSTSVISSHSSVPPPSGEASELGVLDPRLVTQAATYTVTQEGLRTDALSPPNASLLIDRSHGWKGHKVDVAVSNLQHLYVTNGTFTTGVNGTNVNGVPGTYGPHNWTEQVDNGGAPEQNQSTSYYESGGYTIVENEGEWDPIGSAYKHKKFTYVLWNQTVTLNPFTSNFFLRFNYRLDRGPLLGVYSNKLYIVVLFGDDENFAWAERVFAIDITTIGDRDKWQDTGYLSFNETMPSTFNFAIGLFVYNPTNLKLSDLPEIDARYVRVAFDNVSLAGLTKPYPSEVELVANLPSIAPTNVVNVTRGSGSVTATFEYWEVDTIPIIFTSSASVSFDCSVTLHVLNLRNSTWETNSGSEGVEYSVLAGQPVNLTLWTVVSYPSAYLNFKFNVTVPVDWGNAIVHDSFPNDVTSNCTIGSGYVEVSGPIAAQLGWWQLDFQAPNYASTLATQVLNSSGMWQNHTTFWCPNITRVIGSIGVNGDVPAPLLGINSTWLLPDGSMWTQALNVGDTVGLFAGTNLTLGYTNTTAGLWTLQLSWTNGSEVAFDAVDFGLYHKTSLTPIYPIIDVEPGDLITALVRYKDVDNNQTLMEQTASIQANWSTSIVTFYPITLHQWWEGEFNFAVSGPGTFIVRVNATRGYFETSYCYITIKVIYTSRLSSPQAAWDTADWGDLKTIELRFERYNFTDQQWYGITNTTPYVEVMCNWTIGHWTVQPTGVAGIYDLELDTTVVTPGFWQINVNGSKWGHDTSTLTLNLLINGFPTSLEVQGQSVIIVPYGSSSLVTLHYENESTNTPILGATVQIVSISPTEGLVNSTVQDLGNGNYSLTLTPIVLESFTILFQANLTNYQTATVSLYLGTEKIDTEIVSTSSPSQVYIGTNFSVTLNYSCANGGIAGVTPSGHGIAPSEWGFYDHNNGNYTIWFFPSSIGSYQITLRFSDILSNYKPNERDYNFDVVRTPLSIQLTGGDFLEIVEGMPLELSITLYETATNGTVTGAIVEYSIEGQSVITGTLTDMGDGVYSVTIAAAVLPLSRYQVEIRVLASRFYDALDFSTTLDVSFNAPARIAQISAAVMLIVLLLFAMYISSRQIRKRRAAILLKKLAVRQRFEDARNILSVLVIHQKSGLPILSTQMREDVPSELVAGFISAIRHFRKEVVSREEELLRVIPISDVVHICPTKNTLCGLVTLLPPSQQLLERLRKYSIIISNEFDKLLDASERQLTEYVLPPHLIKALETSFDLQLLAPHFNAFSSSVPRRFRKLALAYQQLFANQDANLYELAQELARRGEREEDAYYLIHQAIQAGYLVPNPRTSPLNLITQLQSIPNASSHESDQTEGEGGINDS